MFNLDDIYKVFTIITTGGVIVLGSVVAYGKRQLKTGSKLQHGVDDSKTLHEKLNELSLQVNKHEIDDERSFNEINKNLASIGKDISYMKGQLDNHIKETTNYHD